MSKIYIDRDDGEKVTEWAWSRKGIGVYGDASVSLGAVGWVHIAIREDCGESIDVGAEDIPHLIKALQCARKAIEEEERFEDER